MCHTGMLVRNGNLIALTELQQQRLQVCENNWVRKIAGVTRADRRRIVEGRDGSAEELDRDRGRRGKLANGAR